MNCARMCWRRMGIVDECSGRGELQSLARKKSITEESEVVPDESG